ncbi:MAG: dephospho-CoA kinase [Chloroflexi bacterium]|nr:dephospho-CoA kinase [Chloroflexota bacterium]
MVVIGLTGGIGTGKSEVSRLLRELGAEVIDADKLGHEVYRPHSETWREVVAAFGDGILQPSGEIDRKKLGAIVFNNPEALAKLNAIMHPRMYRMAGERIKALQAQGAKVIVLEAAILIEAGWTPLVDEVWVTTAPEGVVIQRLQRRNNLPEEAVRARIRAQLSQEERARHAQVTVENAGDLAQLRQTVTELWENRIKGKVRGDGPR